MLRNTCDTYGGVAKLLHWVIAIMVIGMLALGYLMDCVPSSSFWHHFCTTTHKTVGILILFAMGIRLLWRLANPQPDCSGSEPFIIKVAIFGMHWFLYLLIIIMPLSGWIMSTASGGDHVPHFFGLVYWPLPGIAAGSALLGPAHEAHGIVAIVIIVALAVHILAAMYHHFIQKDNVLKRMLPQCKK